MFKNSTMILGVLFLFFIFPTIATAQAEYVTIHGYALVCCNQYGKWLKLGAMDSDSSFMIAGDKGVPGDWETTVSRVYVAPVNFPSDANGKYVRNISALVFDDNDQGDIRVSLWRTNIWTGMTRQVFYTGTYPPGETPGKTRVFTSSGSYRKIDNKNFAWHIGVSFAVYSDIYDLKFYNVRIKYE